MVLSVVTVGAAAFAQLVMSSVLRFYFAGCACVWDLAYDLVLDESVGEWWMVEVRWSIRLPKIFKLVQNPSISGALPLLMSTFSFYRQYEFLPAWLQTAGVTMRSLVSTYRNRPFASGILRLMNSCRSSWRPQSGFRRGWCCMHRVIGPGLFIGSPDLPRSYDGDVALIRNSSGNRRSIYNGHRIASGWYDFRRQADIKLLSYQSNDFTLCTGFEIPVAGMLLKRTCRQLNSVLMPNAGLQPTKAISNSRRRE